MTRVLSIAVCDIRSGGGCILEWGGHMDRLSLAQLSHFTSALQPVSALHSHARSVTSLASTADGSIVVSGSADKTIRFSFPKKCITHIK